MSRLNRSSLTYNYYHIITRGNRKQTVFRTIQDYEKYLNILKKAKYKHKILLYAYCLMPNHVHLLIETKTTSNMSKFMQWINLVYATHFNNTYQIPGHLWQGRFISKPILKEKYLIDCADYIESNPIRANMVKDITEYPWNSYKERFLQPEFYLLDPFKNQAAGTVQ